MLFSRFITIPLALTSLSLAGCVQGRVPRISLPPVEAKTMEYGTPEAHQAAQVGRAVSQRKVSRQTAGYRYQGMSLEQWAEKLESRNLFEVQAASRALYIAGPEGRPYLFSGLTSNNADTRRLCLEALSCNDVRAFGQDGKRVLVKLAGDPDDFRVRERAAKYMLDWERSSPSSL